MGTSSASQDSDRSYNNQMRRRKTASERREELDRLRSRAWEDFVRKLERAESYEDALQIHTTPVSTGSPGRSYYSNFGFFMHHFSPPDGATQYELQQYLRLLRCFEKQGALKEGAIEWLEPLFEHAIAARDR